MVKTIRSHPTSHILVLEPNLRTSFRFSKCGPNIDIHFLYFPSAFKVKDRPPKETKCAWTIPSYYIFVKISSFMLHLQSFFDFLGKTQFIQLLSYFNSFVYLRFKYRRPQFIIISEKNSYFKIRTLSQRYIRQWNIPWIIPAK